MEHISRHRWGARPPKYPYTALAGSAGIAVHHLGNGLPPFSDPLYGMRNTQDFHMDGRGWNDFAYGWGVGDNGSVLEGRGWGWVDGADTGVGRIMHSVLWLGDSNIQRPSEAALEAINEVIAEHNRRYGDLRVVGHGDINATTCPGQHLRAWLQAGRPTAAPAPTNEENAVRTIIGIDSRDGRWYHVDGGWKHYLSHPDQVNALTFLGVPVVGELSHGWLDALTTADPERVSSGGPLDGADVAKIAKAVADEQAKRLAS